MLPKALLVWSVVINPTITPAAPFNVTCSQRWVWIKFHVITRANLVTIALSLFLFGQPFPSHAKAAWVSWMLCRSGETLYPFSGWNQRPTARSYSYPGSLPLPVSQWQSAGWQTDLHISTWVLSRCWRSWSHVVIVVNAVTDTVLWRRFDLASV